MERLKSITIIFLLAVGLLTSVAPAKTVSVLLQEGLYAEEIEGDLDAAIKIYKQVISEAKEVPRVAAQATYRIGMCYLKKGEQAKAATHFSNLVSKFPDQKALIAKAQRHLAKLKPPTGGFGPVMERVINDDGVGEDFMFDLDIGKSFSVSDAKKWGDAPDISEKKSLEDFVMKSGIDLFGETSKKSLMGIDMIAMPIHNERWDMSPEDVIEQVSMCKPGTPVALSADGQLPKTFVFKTGQGGMGILQIIEMQAGKAPRHFKIRYKMLQEPAKIAPVEVFGPVIERVVYQGGTDYECLIDFESGKLFKVPEGLKDSRGKESEVLEWVKETGVDAAGDTGGPITSQGLQGFVNDLVARPAVDGWNTTPRELVETMGSLLPEPHGKARMFAKGALPATHFFKTRDGGMGVLQILGFTVGDPRGVRVRYKMLQKESAGLIVFLPDADDVIQQGKVAVVLDLTTGKMLPGNKDKQYFNKLNKGDVAYFDDEGKDLLVCFRGAKITRKTADEKYSDTPDQSHTDNTIHLYIIKKTPAEWTITTKEGDIYELKVLSLDNNQAKIKYRKMPTDGKVWTIKPDLSSPEATIKSFVKAVYDGNLEAAGACVSKDGHDYDEFMEMLATESNHPFQAMIKAMDANIPVEITNKDITEDRCKIKWYFTLGRVYYIGDTKIKKGTHQKFGSYLELVGDKWLIRDI